MTIHLDRRQFIGGASLAASALIAPDIAMAGVVPAGWALGVADVEADIAPAPMRLLRGRVPAGLAGTLYRNGPAKFRRGSSTSGHWFDGDGLVRAFRIADGGARLAARFVDTPKRRLETAQDAMVVPGFGTPAGPDITMTGPDDSNAANTAVLMAGDDLLALWEGGSATAIDPETLATRGFKAFRDDLAQMPFLAHPRVEPDGRIWNLGMAAGRAMIYQLSAAGALIDATLIDLPRASYIHDFTATDRKLVFVLQPLLQDSFALPFVKSLSWRPDLGTQVMVVDKDDLTKRRVFELPTFAFFHLGDAWEERDGTIRFDACITRDPTFALRAAADLVRGVDTPAPPPLLAQIVLHASGRGELRPTRTTAEFPSGDKRRAGKPRRHVVHVAGYDRGPFTHGVGMWDWNRGADDVHDFGGRQLAEEFLFVPRGDGERDGWLVGCTLNLDERATELHVLDAGDVAAGPICTWRADHALPIGFHGTFHDAHA